MLTPFQHNTLLHVSGRGVLTIGDDPYYGEYLRAAQWLKEKGYLSASYRITEKGKAYFDDLQNGLAR